MSQVCVGRVEDFADDVRKGVVIDGREVFVFQRGDRFYAFENNCPHRGGPVGEGTLIGRVEAVVNEKREVVMETFSETTINIVCPWHGYEFNIADGVCAADRRIRLRRYRVFEEDGKVYVSE